MRGMFAGEWIGKKDKKGTKILEGDKVLVNYGKHYNEPKGLIRIGKIVYCKKSAAFVVEIENSAVKVRFWDVDRIEVIKGIHESEVD